MYNTINILQRKIFLKRFGCFLTLKIDFENEILALFDSYFGPFYKSHVKFNVIFVISSIMALLSNVFKNSFVMMKNLHLRLALPIQLSWLLMVFVMTKQIMKIATLMVVIAVVNASTLITAQNVFVLEGHKLTVHVSIDNLDTVPEIIDSGLMCITVLFQNNYLA